MSDVTRELERCWKRIEELEETNTKWKEAVQKLKEEFKDTGVEDFIDKIFAKLTQ